MKTFLLVDGGRLFPPALQGAEAIAGYCFQPTTTIQSDWQQLLDITHGLLLVMPAWSNGHLVDAIPFWQLFMRKHYPKQRLVIASVQAITHSNHLDLLDTQSYDLQWWDNIPAVQEMEDFPQIDGLNLMHKLKRFFDGHGDDSVLAVLTRIRMLVQMAVRELKVMDTSYEEIFQELIEPAQLAHKWGEWLRRWNNYAPLFHQTPFAGELEKIAQASKEIEPWMLDNGRAVAPLLDDSVLEVLNYIRGQLQDIEQSYVVKKLSPTYR